MFKYNKFVEKLMVYVILLISILLSPTIIILLLVSSVYYLLINLLLKYQHGDQFKGMLEGMDAAFGIEDATKSVTHVMHIVETDDIDKMEGLGKMKFFNLIKDPSYEKLLYLRRKSYGYSFWKTGKKVEPDEIIKCIENTNDSGITMDDLQKFISEYSNQKLPRDHSLSFEVIIIKKPIIENQLKTNKYPILYRFHHALVDGDSMKRIFYAISSNNIIGNIDNDNQTENKTKSTLLRKMILQFIVNILPVFISVELLLKKLFQKRENHILCASKKLSGEKIVRWKIGNDIFKYMKKAKENIPASTYSTIIFTSLCDSLNKYYLKKTNAVPEMIQLVFPLSTTKLIPININRKLKDSKLNNNFLLTTVQFPLKYFMENKTILDRFNVIRNMINQISSTYLLVYYFALNIGAKYLPEPLFKMFRSLESSSISFSYYYEKRSDLCIDSASTLDNVMFWIPNTNLTGLCISVLGFNNYVNFGILADKAVISNENEIDEILENMIVGIKNLAKEVEDRNVT